MSNITKLLLLSFVLYFVSALCFSYDYLIIIALGVVLRLIGMLAFIVWLLIFIRAIENVTASQLRCCPSCLSRHYIANVRGSRFGFAFPARWVKKTRTDFRCQDCGHDWSINEEEERDADS